MSRFEKSHFRQVMNKLLIVALLGLVAVATGKGKGDSLATGKGKGDDDGHDAPSPSPPPSPSPMDGHDGHDYAPSPSPPPSPSPMDMAKTAKMGKKAKGAKGAKGSKKGKGKTSGAIIGAGVGAIVLGGAAAAYKLKKRKAVNEMPAQEAQEVYRSISIHRYRDRYLYV